MSLPLNVLPLFLSMIAPVINIYPQQKQNAAPYFFSPLSFFVCSFCGHIILACSNKQTCRLLDCLVVTMPKWAGRGPAKTLSVLRESEGVRKRVLTESNQSLPYVCTACGFHDALDARGLQMNVLHNSQDQRLYLPCPPRLPWQIMVRLGEHHLPFCRLPQDVQYP